MTLRRHSLKTGLLLSGVAFLAVPLSPLAAQQAASDAQAPQAASAADGIRDIVVTARRREEANQDVPIAVTALSADTLRQERIVTPNDLTGRVPSLAVSSAGQLRSTEQFTLRGQGSTFQGFPSVVTYLSEVALPTPTSTQNQGAPGNFLDLENLQVLKGPQGTLFGRNTTGGAVLLVPRRPNNELGGYIQGQIGNYKDREIEGAINVPVVSDVLMVRAAGRFVDRAGYTKDVVTGKGYDDRHYYTGRLGIVFRPTDGIENYLMAYGTDSHDNGTGNILTHVDTAFLDGQIAGVLHGAAPNGRNGCADLFAGDTGACETIQGYLADQKARGKRRTALSADPNNHQRTWGVTDILSVELSDSLTLRNIASYSELESSYRWDQDGSLMRTGDQINPDTINRDHISFFSEEIQLQGSLVGNMLDYTVGAYTDRTKPIGLQRALSRIAFVIDADQTFGVTRKSKALYAQATLDLGALTPALTNLNLTGGYRYTWDRVRGFGTFVGTFAAPADAAGFTFCLNGGSLANGCRFDGSSRTSAPTWTIGLDYKITPRTLLYGKVSRGYKAGGYNAFAVFAADTTFGPEYVTAYEIGAKTDFRVADIPVRLNVAAYRSIYKDIQRTAGKNNPATGGGGAAVYNADARIQGVEVETTVQLTPAFQVSAAYSYMDAGYTSFLLPQSSPGGQLDCTGRVILPPNSANITCIPFQFAPKNQISISPQLLLPLPDTYGRLTLGGTYSYSSPQYAAPISVPSTERQAFLDPINLVNLYLSWSRIMDSSIDATLFVTNATNEAYRQSNSAVFATQGFTNTIYSEPRMYGVQLRYNF